MAPKIFLEILIGFIAGVFLASVFSLSFFSAAATGVAAAALFLFFILKRKKLFLFIAVAALSIALGIFRLDIADISLAQNNLSTFTSGQNVEGVGQIVADPDQRPTMTQLTVAVASINHQEISGEPNLLVRADPYVSTRYGDTINFSGELDAPASFQTLGGRSFDYAGYLAQSGIIAIVDRASIEVEKSTFTISGALYDFKNWSEQSLENSVPPPESGLLSGLIFGDRSLLSKIWQNDFQKAGVIHIIVLSGYNLTLVGAWLLILLRRFPLPIRGSLAIFGIILYAMMTGGNPSAVRAGILSSLLIVAALLHRKADAGRLTIFAGAVMLAINPLLLAHDPSFQFSFLAVLGLIYISPIISPWLDFISRAHPKLKMIQEIAVATISAELLVLPLLLYEIGLLSLVGLFANLLVVPLVPPAMFLGVVAAVFGYTPLSIVFGAPAYFISWLTLAIIHFFASVPYSAVIVPAFSFGVVMLIYFVYFVIGWRFQKKIFDEENAFVESLFGKEKPA